MKSFFAATTALTTFAYALQLESPPLLSALDMATAFEGPSVLDAYGNKTLTLKGATGVKIVKHAKSEV